MSKRVGKGHAPPGEIYALGSANLKSKVGSETDLKQTASGTQIRKGTLPSHSSTGSIKREASSAPVPAAAVKKPRLGSPVYTPLGRLNELDRRSSPSTQNYLYEDIATDVDGAELIDAVEDAAEKSDFDRVEALLCGAVKHLKANRAKPDPAICLALMVLAKTQPALFASELLVEAFCSLLKRDVTLSFKAKGNAAVSVLTCNVLMAAFQDDENWPDSFVKVYIDDSLGERIWVDRPDCKVFVENIQAAFGTKLPKISMVATEGAGKSETPGGSSPVHFSAALLDDDDSMGQEDKYGKDFMLSDEDITSLVFPRYTYQQTTIETYVLEAIREQLTRRQPIDGGGSRSLVRTMTSVAGYAEIRTIACQKLELWLQNPKSIQDDDIKHFDVKRAYACEDRSKKQLVKLTRPAQDLLMTICLNCNQQLHPQDVDVTNALSKIRLKTKSLVSHYLLSMKELLGQNVENYRRLLVQTVNNEMSASRSPNNMMLFTVMFQQAPEQTSKLLAEVFLELLMGREDCLRSLRTLLREVVRAVKHDINIYAFCLALMHSPLDIKLHECDQLIKDRFCTSVIDLVCLAMLLSVTTSVRESASAVIRADIKDLEILRNFQKIIAFIQNDAVMWLNSVVSELHVVKSSELMHCLRKVLFVEKAEHYYKLDNWPPENERNILLRLVAEVPLLENTLCNVLTMSLNRELHLGNPDVLDLIDTVVRRAAHIHTEEFPALMVTRVDVMDLLLNLCAYRQHEGIYLPPGYQPPILAVGNLYWKAWVVLLLLSAFNPATLGKKAWYEYPTLRCLMEMTMTNCYKFPPPSTVPDDASSEEFRSREIQMIEFVKQQILEFESHLAAATSKQVITESNTVLVSLLTRMDPTGMALRPPPSVVEQLKSVNHTLRVGHMLCRCRQPDFLLEIIQQQGTSQSMPWLADLVESNDSSLDVLPVQCLCEFLIHDTAPGASQSTTAANADEEDAMRVDKTKKQKHHKQEQLLMRLQGLLQTTNSESRVAVSEVIDYFLKRLGSPQSSTRRLAVKGLSMVLSKSLLEDSEQLSPMEISGYGNLLPQHRWLLEQLPAIPLFELVKINVCTALRQACQFEFDVPTVSSYVIFLSQHTFDLDLHELDGLAQDMAQLIVERATLISHLLPQESIFNDRADQVLVAIIDIMYAYLMKAQQPQGEGFQWSESQDQIRLQWQSGKSAVINILVVHAMIILLAYQKPVGSSKYTELLECWFPENGSPPLAFLVDTSEEALLLPDWLKLRMIRSSVSRLVDAALSDLEPAQLLLFVQSFGIPVDSMSQLLQCLDTAVAMDPDAMDTAIVDKSYMAQLIEVQRMRGAVGGNKFYQLLLDGHSPPQQLESASLLKSIPRTRTLSQISRTADSSLLNVTEIDSIAAILLKIFDLAPCVDRNSQFQIVLKTIRKPDADVAADTVIRAMLLLMTSPKAPTFFQGLVYHSHMSCSLLRILMLRKGCFDQLANLLSTACVGVKSPLTAVLDRYKNRNRLTEVTAECHGQKDQVLQTVLKQVEQCRHVDDHMESLIDNCLQNTLDRSIVDDVLQSVTCDATDNVTSHCTGKLVDWLELSSHGIIDGNNAPLDAHVDFLFGVAPRDKNQSSTMSSSSGSNKSLYSRTYFLSLVAHQCRWSTVSFIVQRLLSSPDHVNRYNATAVLDFLSACVHSPKLWQGRDKKLPKNYAGEDVLGLTPQQAVVMVCYMLSEAKDANGSPDDGLALLDDRLKFLQECCNNRRHLVNAVVAYLVACVNRNSGESDLCRHLLLDIYLWFPNGVSGAHQSVNRNILNTVSNQPSKLDSVTHQVVHAFGNAAPGKASEVRMKDSNTACRKIASQHPALILRQLPLLTALLQGRAQYSLGELRHRNYMLLYSHVLGVAELLQPHIFQPQYSQSFQRILEAFFDLIQIHGRHTNKQLVSILVKFIQLLHDFLIHHRCRCSKAVGSHLHLLNGLSHQFPDIPLLGSLLAGLSLPVSEPNTIASDASLSSAPASTAVGTSDVQITPLEGSTAKQLCNWSPWILSQIVQIKQGTQRSAAAAEICNRLQELDELSKRYVDVLEHFTETLQWLMLHSNETCRNASHSLMMRLVRHNPTFGKEFFPTVNKCLQSTNSDIVTSALKNFPEFVILSQEHAVDLMLKAFVVGVTNHVDTTTCIREAFQLLNLETMI